MDHGPEGLKDEYRLLWALTKTSVVEEPYWIRPSCNPLRSFIYTTWGCQRPYLRLPLSLVHASWRKKKEKKKTPKPPLSSAEQKWWKLERKKGLMCNPSWPYRDFPIPLKMVSRTWLIALRIINTESGHWFICSTYVGLLSTPWILPLLPMVASDLSRIMLIKTPSVHTM